MNGRRWLLPVAVAVALVQIGFLSSMIAGRAAILRDGSEVVLKVEPIDPRDLLRGDYVVLSYAISSLPAELFAEPPADGATVFVRLKAQDDGFWQPVAARIGAPPEPAPTAGEVDIRGVVGSGWAGGAQRVLARYGIERFYVPEGEGRAIETGLGTRDFRVKVAVARDGTAQIRSLFEGETMLYAEPLY